MIAVGEYECVIQHAVLFKRPDELLDYGVELPNAAIAQRFQRFAPLSWFWPL